MGSTLSNLEVVKRLKTFISNETEEKILQLKRILQNAITYPCTAEQHTVSEDDINLNVR